MTFDEIFIHFPLLDIYFLISSLPYIEFPILFHRSHAHYQLSDRQREEEQMKIFEIRKLREIVINNVPFIISQWWFKIIITNARIHITIKYGCIDKCEIDKRSSWNLSHDEKKVWLHWNWNSPKFECIVTRKKKWLRHWDKRNANMILSQFYSILL